MIVRFWRWLTEDPVDYKTPVDLYLAERIFWLESELSKANRRIFQLTQRSRVVEERPGLNSSSIGSEPIQLKSHKPIEARRAELEKLSAKRAAVPEVQAKQDYWASKVTAQEKEIFAEMDALEEFHGKAIGE